MKTKKTILQAIVITSMTLITATTTFAQSDNDHSKVPIKCQFSEKLYSKVGRNMNSTNPTGVIDLNPFEQKKFKHFGINVGNKFSSNLRNIDVIFKRTSAGLKIVDVFIFDSTCKENILPLKNVSKVSIQKHFHVGHNHKRIPIEWNFGDSKNAKIVKHMFEHKGKLSIGLTHLEQNLLTEYGIKSGNKFQLSISGHSFLVEKNSGGLIILNRVKNANLENADLRNDTVKDNI